MRQTTPVLVAVVIIVSLLSVTGCQVSVPDAASAQAVLVYDEESPTPPTGTPDPLRHVVSSGLTPGSRWLYGSFIVQVSTLTQGREAVSDGLTESDFDLALVKQLALAKRMDALVGTAIEALGDPPARRRVIMAMPRVPDKPDASKWPHVTGDPSIPLRKRIVSWYLAKVRAIAGGVGLTNLSVAGSYWVPEAIITTPQTGAESGRVYDDELMAFWAASVDKESGSSSWWAPYHGAPRSNDAHEKGTNGVLANGNRALGVDYVSVQPSYVFHEAEDGGYLDSARVRAEGPKLLAAGETNQIELRGNSDPGVAGEAEDLLNQRSLGIASAQKWVTSKSATVTFSARRVTAMAEGRPVTYQKLVDVLAGGAVTSPDPTPQWTTLTNTATSCVRTASLSQPASVAALLVSGMPKASVGSTPAKVSMRLTAVRSGSGSVTSRTQSSWAVAPTGDDAWRLPLETAPVPGVTGTRRFTDLRLEITGAGCPAGLGADGLPNLQPELADHLQWTHAAGPTRSATVRTSAGAPANDLMTAPYHSAWANSTAPSQAGRLVDGLTATSYGSTYFVSGENPGHSNLVIDLLTARSVSSVRLHLFACDTPRGLVWPQRISVAIGGAPSFDVNGSGPEPSGGATLNYEDAGWAERLGSGVDPMEAGCTRWVEVPVPSGVSGRYVSVVIHDAALVATDEIQVMAAGANIAANKPVWATPPLKTTPSEHQSLGSHTVRLNDGRILDDGIGSFFYRSRLWVGLEGLTEPYSFVQTLAVPVEASSVEIWQVKDVGSSFPAGTRVLLADATGAVFQDSPMPAASLIGDPNHADGHVVMVNDPTKKLVTVSVALPNGNTGWTVLTEIVVRPRQL